MKKKNLKIIKLRLKKNYSYKNVLPPLSLLGTKDEKELIDSLHKLNFSIKSLMAA